MPIEREASDDHPDTETLSNEVLEERSEGIFTTIANLVTGLIEAVPGLPESREVAVRRRQEQDANEQAALAELHDTPMRELEDRLGVDDYHYAQIHSGYSTHPRYKRPVSRSEEQKRFRRAEHNIEERQQRRAEIDTDSSKGSESAE